MTEKKEMPSRDDLNEAFTSLQDQITRIMVDEEEEMIREEHGEHSKNKIN